MAPRTGFGRSSDRDPPLFVVEMLFKAFLWTQIRIQKTKKYFPRKASFEFYNGSPNWIRTSDLPVNSRLLYRWAIEEYNAVSIEQKHYIQIFKKSNFFASFL